MTAKSTSRSAARLAAVQALFQHQMEKTPATKLIKEFHDHRLGKEIVDEQYHLPVRDFFDALDIGVTSRMEEIDGLVESKLAKGWTLGRLDKTMLQILRCGTFELVAYDDVPIATVIDEYLDVAHAFFNKKDAGFVNGLLDSIAKQVRG